MANSSSFLGTFPACSSVSANSASCDVHNSDMSSLLLLNRMLKSHLLNTRHLIPKCCCFSGVSRAPAVVISDIHCPKHFHFWLFITACYFSDICRSYASLKEENVNDSEYIDMNYNWSQIHRWVSKRSKQ